jgi:hypothetical protein
MWSYTSTPHHVVLNEGREKGKVVHVLNKHYAMKAYGGWMYRSTFSGPRY